MTQVHKTHLKENNCQGQDRNKQQHVFHYRILSSREVVFKIFKYYPSSKCEVCEFIHNSHRRRLFVLYEIKDYERIPKFSSDAKRGKIPRLMFKIAAVPKNAGIFCLAYSRLQKLIFKGWIYTSGTNEMGMTQKTPPLLCS